MESASRVRRRPAWAAWAYDLAHDLIRVWPWLRTVPWAQVAATLGTRLGPAWTATAVADWVTPTRGCRDLPIDIHSPLALLRQLLDHALTGDAEPPHVARRAAVAAGRRSPCHGEVAAVATRRAALDDPQAWPAVASPGAGA